MAWRDYSETNYGYDAYDEKMQGPNAMQLTQTPPHYPPANGHGNGGMASSHSNGGGNGYGHHAAAPPSMSLPRPHHGQPQSQPSTQSMMRQSNGNGGPSGGSNGLNHNPDFYFMPSQRKYSGEMVRVFVDHSKR